MTEEMLHLTDSEQDLYNALSDADKAVFHVLRLASKVERREVLTRLQDVTLAVQQVRKNTEKTEPGLSDFVEAVLSAVGQALTTFRNEWRARKGYK